MISSVAMKGSSCAMRAAMTFGLHDEAFADILKGAQYDVCGEERLGKGHAAVCTGTAARGEK